MKKKIQISLLFLLLTSYYSCNTLSNIIKQEIVINNQECNFNLVDNKMLIIGNVNNRKCNFIFDTGASASFITDSNLIVRENEKYQKNFHKISLPDGKKINIDQIPITIETNLFTLKNYLIYLIFSDNKIECKENPCGTIGMNFLKGIPDEIIKLNFENNKIQIINRMNLISETAEFAVIPSKFKRKNFSIDINLDGIKIPFLFDTGNFYSFTILNNIEFQNLNFKKEYFGSPFTTVLNPIKENTLFFEDIEFTFINNKCNEDFAQILLKNGKMNSVGIDFIKQFNWIIDYKNKKVFAKKNDLIFDKIPMPSYKYLFFINNNKIVLASKLKGENLLDIGDEVISVDDVLITSENICEMQKKLMENNKNLENLSLKVKKKTVK